MDLSAPERNTLDEILAHPEPHRGVFCNRTLNLRRLRAIGFDMDYTLVHYRVGEWEQRAYDYLSAKLLERGWPVEALTFDRDFLVRGLVIDRHLGNIVKTDRFGYVKSANHGTRRLPFAEQRKLYARTLVDIEDRERFAFLNTFFSLSEGCMFAQLVDLLDEGGRLPDALGYADVARIVRASLDEAHYEGRLKAEIVNDPDRFVDLDPDAPRALLDLKDAGKKLLLITNSGWAYTKEMMEYGFDQFLPGAMTWRQLFDLVIVSARKPGFFSSSSPILEVVDEERGLLKPIINSPEFGHAYYGGSAAAVEEALGLSGSEILYLGDHIYADVQASKSLLRWRTGLIVRELERELQAIEGFKSDQRRFTALMAKKEHLEHEYSQLRLEIQRLRKRRSRGSELGHEQLQEAAEARREALVTLDEEIGQLARAAGALLNQRWGLLLRSGRDKSYLARQIENSADIYTSRVSNLLFVTPFAYLRGPRGWMPHDRGPERAKPPS